MVSGVSGDPMDFLKKSPGINVSVLTRQGMSVAAGNL